MRSCASGHMGPWARLSSIHLAMGRPEWAQGVCGASELRIRNRNPSADKTPELLEPNTKGPVAVQGPGTAAIKSKALLGLRVNLAMSSVAPCRRECVWGG